MNEHSNGPKTGLEPIAKRVPIERTVDLRYPNFEGLITAMSANLSTTGMFVRTDAPKMPGMEFDFSIRIEEWSPVQGVARVVWIRPHSESPERPAGMGVQFVELDGPSRRMIRWLVDKNLQAGGRTFDVDRVPAGASNYAPGPRAKKGNDLSGSGRRRPARDQRTKPHRTARTRRLGVTLGLLLLIAGSYVAYRSWFAPEPDPTRQRSVAASASRPTQTDPDTAEIDTAAEDPAVHAAASAVDHVSAEAITSFVRIWATAWESRDAEAVRALYADDFDASAYGGRSAWVAEIDQLMADSEFLRIAVSALEIGFPDPDRPTATFYRSWRSDQGDETRRMVLELEPAGDSWKILSERYLD